MIKSKTFKRLYKDYTSKFLGKILLAAVFSVLVALSTSATAWLLDPAIEKIFINKDQTLIILIPVAIIIAFSAKGISLYFAKLIMINVSEEVKKLNINQSFDCLSKFKSNNFLGLVILINIFIGKLI